MLFKKFCCCIQLRTGALAIAGFNLMLGISILFMNGSDYEDWYVLYIPASIAVICGAVLFYGAIFNKRFAILLHLIVSCISIIFYGIAAVALFTLSHQVGTTIACIFLVIGMLQCYFWFCIFSFYKFLE